MPSPLWMTMSPSSSPGESPLGRQLGVRWHHEQLFSDEPAGWPILKIIQDRLTGLGGRAPKPVHLEGPHGVGRATAATLQLPRLIEIANAHAGGDLLFRRTNGAARNDGRGPLRHLSG